MANTEFIAAKDLPTTEAEEVDVLCVEGGELKRKPGASLGGGGGFLTVDIVLNDTNWGSPSSVSFSKTYDEIKEAIEKGYTVIGWAQINQFTGEQSYQYCGGYIRPAFPRYAPNINDGTIFFFPTDPEYVSYYISFDGTTGSVSD